MDRRARTVRRLGRRRFQCQTARGVPLDGVRLRPEKIPKAYSATAFFSITTFKCAITCMPQNRSSSRLSFGVGNWPMTGSVGFVVRHYPNLPQRQFRLDLFIKPLIVLQNCFHNFALIPKSHLEEVVAGVEACMFRKAAPGNEEPLLTIVLRHLSAEFVEGSLPLGRGSRLDLDAQ